MIPRVRINKIMHLNESNKHKRLKYKAFDFFTDLGYEAEIEKYYYGLIDVIARKEKCNLILCECCNSQPIKKGIDKLLKIRKIDAKTELWIFTHKKVTARTRKLCKDNNIYLNEVDIKNEKDEWV